MTGASDYEIERTPLVPGTEDPSGPAVITGLWRPNRTVTPEAPTFADSGYEPGAAIPLAGPGEIWNHRTAVLRPGLRRHAPFVWSDGVPHRVRNVAGDSVDVLRKRGRMDAPPR